MALRDLTDGRRLPCGRASPYRWSVRRLQRLGRLPRGGASRGRDRLRGPLLDTSIAGRPRERGLLPRRRGGRPRRAGLPGDGGRREGWQASGLARGSPDRSRVDPHGREPDDQGRADAGALTRSHRDAALADGPAEGDTVTIHEYQAKELLKSYGIPVPPGEVVYSDRAAARVAEELGGSRWVVKAQIHAGGRGKGGGVKLANSVGKVTDLADQMIGSTLVTAQTGDAGKRVQRVLIERASRIDREFYLGMIVDRVSQKIVVIASAEGGVDIEQVASERPEAIHTEFVDPGVGLLEFQCRKIATAIGLSNRAVSFTRLLGRIYRLFRDKDCLLLEINPFIVTEDGDLVALDCKMQFDDNALYRQSAVAELRDFDEEDPKEVDASGHGLNYVALDGKVGCIVNGAGLAMGTMDAIAHHGGRPANFLDVGGGASPEKIANAFRIVLTDPNVRAILVNIFAGINRCDWIAQGVVQAAKDLRIDVPVIVRLAGTNVEEGRRILTDSGLSVIQAADLDDAAAKAVTAVSEVAA